MTLLFPKISVPSTSPLPVRSCSCPRSSTPSDLCPPQPFIPLIPDPLPSILRDDIYQTHQPRSHYAKEKSLTPSINNPRYPAQDRQTDADPERGATSDFCEGSDWWEDNADEVEEHVGAGGLGFRHVEKGLKFGCGKETKYWVESIGVFLDYAVNGFGDGRTSFELLTGPRSVLSIIYLAGPVKNQTKEDV